MTEFFLQYTLEYWVTVFVLGLARVSAFIMTFPFFRFARIPATVKISIAFFLTLIWIVNRHEDVHMSMQHFKQSSWVFLGVSITKEVIIGAALGFALGLVFLPARIAGSIIGQEMGLSLASLTDPNTGQTTSVVSELFFAAFVLVYLEMDAHLLTIGAVLRSFDLVPIASADAMLSPILLAKGIDASQHMAIQLVSPILGGLLVVTVVLAVIMKISPQLNLFTFGTQIRLLAGLSSLCLFFPEVVIAMHEVVTTMFQTVAKFGF